MTVFDLSRDGLDGPMVDAQWRRLDEIRHALVVTASALEAQGDPRGVTPSTVAYRAHVSVGEARAFLDRLVTEGHAACTMAGRHVRYRPVGPQ